MADHRVWFVVTVGSAHVARSFAGRCAHRRNAAGRRAPPRCPTWAQLRPRRTPATCSGSTSRRRRDRPGRIAALFGLHDEMLRDSAEFDQRTRLADYDGYLLVVMYGVAPDAETMMEVHLYVTSRHDHLDPPGGPCPPLEALHDRADHAVTAQHDGAGRAVADPLDPRRHVLRCTGAGR